MLRYLTITALAQIFDNANTNVKKRTFDIWRFGGEALEEMGKISWRRKRSPILD